MTLTYADSRPPSVDAPAVWFVWHGGPNYAAPYVPADVETAESVADVVRICQERLDNVDGRTPCVDTHESGALVWRYGRPDEDEYPDEIVEYGRRTYRVMGA